MSGPAAALLPPASPRARRAAPSQPGAVTAERGKLQDSIVEYYEAEIFAGRLPVGTRMPAEAEIARLFAVSTRTIRDAMQVLETKGLIQRRHGECAVVVRDDVGGFLDSLALTVKQLCSSDARYFVELMDVRRIVELDVVERLASSGGVAGAEVMRALQGMEAAARAGDAAGFARCDVDFHVALVRSVPNKILHILYDNLYGLISDVIQVSARVPRKSLDDAYEEHAGIYRLIQAGDGQAARSAIAQHIEASAGYVQIAIAARAQEPSGAGKDAPRARAEEA
ncbi:FadR/GntR family transcriptional regulator [Roseomonas elaeocarpi]|uniref:FadR/GntR family transcriptional regulator n=1 Tax=Roseomonas elaeocarpi TaxID=907779 RepID=A0ABV6JWD5_9PROT